MPNLLSCSAVGARPTSPTGNHIGILADPSAVHAKGFDELSAHWESTVPQLSALQDCRAIPHSLFLYLGDVWSDWGR